MLIYGSTGSATVKEIGMQIVTETTKSNKILPASIAGDMPCENSLLRQVSSLLRRLPTVESAKFQDDFLMVSD